MVGDLDVNLLVIENGCGWLYYPNGIGKELRSVYETAFLAAKAARIGLFANVKAVTPQVWRKKKHRLRRRI